MIQQVTEKSEPRPWVQKKVLGIYFTNEVYYLTHGDVDIIEISLKINMANYGL
jgi:hypothetical protein